MSSDDDSNPARCGKFTAERTPVSFDDTDENNTANQDQGEAFGPALPPHLIAKNKLEMTNESNEACETVYGPQLPQRLVDVSEKTEVYGPKIPERLNSKNMIGPQVPEHLLPAESDEDQHAGDDEDVQYGPSLSLMTDGDTPVPVNFRESKPKESSETATKRESWMVELPPERAVNFGLGPRQFRTKLPTEKESDRRGWTETPTDKGKEKGRSSKDDAKIIKQKQIEEKNKEMEALIRKLVKKKKKKEKESLVEIHRKKAMKKAKKEAKKQEKEPKPVERRPFDRNIDLQVHRFDESQKRAMLRKAALLHNRFESGESKFL